MVEGNAAMGGEAGEVSELLSGFLLAPLQILKSKIGPTEAAFLTPATGPGACSIAFWRNFHLPQLLAWSSVVERMRGNFRTALAERLMIDRMPGRCKQSLPVRPERETSENISEGPLRRNEKAG